MTLNEQNILALLQPLLLAALPIVVGIVGSLIRAEMVKKNIRTDVFDAATRAAAVGYAWMTKQNKSIRDPMAVAQAVGMGLDYMAKHLPEKMQAIGMTSAVATDVVGAEIDKLIAADPTIGPDSSTPAPAPQRA